MTTIYLSSTYEDLKDHRKAVCDALRKSRYEVIAMEDYVAADKPPLDKCLEGVAGADIYVGLFAFRYGYIPPRKPSNPRRLSITELEFRCAERSGKTCLVFVVDEKAPWPRIYDDAHSGNGKQISKLRQYLLTKKMAGLFTLPLELAALVQSSITTHHTLAKADEPALPTARMPSWDIARQGPPFPGREHFSLHHAPVFFGRDADVRAILDRLHTPRNRFVIVSGDSGVGKSSVVEAGVLPKMEAGALPGGACVRVHMTPNEGDPFDTLASALHSRAGAALLDPQQLGAEWRRTPASLAAGLRAIASAAPGKGTLVLFLDQMEELLGGQKTDEQKAVAAAFLSEVYAAAAEKKVVRVIATLRSDFLDDCRQHPQMVEVLRGDGWYRMDRVADWMMVEMITQPARRAGLKISEGLVGRLVEYTGGAPGGLPLLAIVLRRLFDKRTEGTLSEDADHSFDSAIAAHVSVVEDGLRATLGEAVFDRLRRIFPVLLKVDAEGLPTRRRAPCRVFSAELRPIVDKLVRGRLLSTEGEGDASTVSVAHERLFTTWPALAHWISENQDDLRILRRAETEAREWATRHHYATEYLWQAARQKRLQDVLARVEDPSLPQEVLAFARPQEHFQKLLGNSELGHPERATIGKYLAELSDPRPGVGLLEDGTPDIDWVPIPAGRIELEGTNSLLKFAMKRQITPKSQMRDRRK